MRTPLNSRLALAVVALLGLTGAAAHAQIGETYYIPLPSTQVKIWADTQTVRVSLRLNQAEEQ